MPKPSERLGALEEEDLKTIMKPLQGVQVPEDVWTTFRCVAAIRALSRYLDEQHEIERRREYLRIALSLAVVGHWETANHFLRRAGLEYEVLHTTGPKVVEHIIDAAEKDGLL